MGNKYLGGRIGYAGGPVNVGFAYGKTEVGGTAPVTIDADGRLLWWNERLSSLLAIPLARLRAGGHGRELRGLDLADQSIRRIDEATRRNAQAVQQWTASPGGDGAIGMKQARARGHGATFIMVTAFASVDSAIDASLAQHGRARALRALYRRDAAPVVVRPLTDTTSLCYSGCIQFPVGILFITWLLWAVLLHSMLCSCAVPLP